jgi:hypothetical protein
MIFPTMSLVLLAGRVRNLHRALHRPIPLLLFLRASEVPTAPEYLPQSVSPVWAIAGYLEYG